MDNGRQVSSSYPPPREVDARRLIKRSAPFAAVRAGNSRVRFRIGIDPAGAEAELRSRKPPDNGTPGCSSPDAKAGGEAAGNARSGDRPCGFSRPPARSPAPIRARFT
jgi:hypothetical protein